MGKIMKKSLLIVSLLCLAFCGYAQDVKRVAILEVVDKENKLAYSQKLMLRSTLAKAITNTAGYEAYDRTDIDAIMGEQNFQRTGMVSDEQIKKLGEMTGAAYILVAEGAVADESNLFVTAKILNVETGRIERTESSVVGVAAKQMQRGCSNLAYNLFNNLTAGSGNAAASTSKFLSIFQSKGNDGNKQDNSAAASKKEEQAANAAQAKEQKRLEEEQKRQEAERARQEQLEAQEREKQAKLLAEEQAKEQKRLEEEQKRQEAERARQEKIEAQEREKQAKLLAEEQAREQKRLEEEQKAAEEAERLKYSITKVSNNEYRLQNQSMDRKAYEQFVYENCPEAWKKIVTGKRSIITGWTFLGVGVALSSAWGMLPLGTYYYEGRDATYYITAETRNDWELTGIIAGSIGAAMALVSVPLLAGGYSTRANSYKTYNKQCAGADKKPSVSLNFQVNQNGVGLAMHF